VCEGDINLHATAVKSSCYAWPLRNAVSCNVNESEKLILDPHLELD